MPLGDLAGIEGSLDGFGSGKQAEGVGDTDAGAANSLGDGGLGKTEFVDQLAVGGGFFQWGEIGPGDILDEGQLEHGARGRFLDDNGDGGEAGEPGGAPAALASDQHVAVALWTTRDDERLNDAVSTDRVGEGREGVGVKGDTRLVGIRLDGVDVDVETGGMGGFVGAGRDERTKPAAETALPGEGGARRGGDVAVGG